MLGSRRAEAVEHLQNYYGTNLYTGRWFDRLYGGGDHSDIADRLTAGCCTTLSDVA